MKRVLAAIALAALAGSTLLHAAAGTAAAAETEPALRIEAILDASGSMKAKDASGQTRLEAAKQAVARLIDEVPDRASMGVRVYGASYAGQEPGPGCRDTQLLSPVAPMDAAAKRAAQAQIRSIEAVGMTPIGHALSTAAKDLGGSGPRRIILVSDGADTCGPPTACTVAQGLSGAGIDLVVDTVGFRVDDGARQELKCISQVTKGSYTDAADADELAAGMGDSVERAFTPYQVSGERVHGADSCEKAPLLEPGHYQDATAYQQQRWYKVRLRPGERLRFSGAVIPRASYDLGVMHVYLHLPGRSRFWAFQPSVTSKWSTIISVGIRSDRLGSDEVPAGADSAEVCAQLVNKVRSETGEHPVEVSVGREGPSGTDDGEPDPQAGTPPAGQSNHLIPRASARPSAHLTRAGALGAGAVVLVLPFLLTASRRRGC